MTIPYKCRLVATIDGNDIELARYKRAPASLTIRLTTRGLSCPWRCEKTLADRDTITPRFLPPMSHEAMKARARNARENK